MCNFLYGQWDTAQNDLREHYKYTKTPFALWKLDTPLWAAIEMFVLSPEEKKCPGVIHIYINMSKEWT